jgi:hypothetical protein
MAKYTCPDPATIVEGLFDLYAMFHDMDDPVNPGRKVLASNALKILKTEMGYVQKGLLSDIPGMPMYYATGKLSTGFETNRCVRGTPSLEGMHLHYRASQHPGAKASNLFNLNVRTNLWHWDWNVHGAVRAKLIPNIGHTDLWLVDAIIDALHGLDLKCVPFELRAWERTRTDVKPLTTIGVQFAQLGIVAKQLDHLPRTLLRKNIAAQLGTSDDAIDCIVKGDTPRLAKVFGVLTSMKHCEELERRAQETVATNNALKPVLREVEMRVRKESEPTEPGHQPRPTPNRGTPRALPVHIDHNAHLEVNFADAQGGGDCDEGRFASPRSSGAAATASPLGGTNHPRGSTGRVLPHPLSWSGRCDARARGMRHGPAGAWLRASKRPEPAGA